MLLLIPRSLSILVSGITNVAFLSHMGMGQSRFEDESSNCHVNNNNIFCICNGSLLILGAALGGSIPF